MASILSVISSERLSSCLCKAHVFPLGYATHCSGLICVKKSMLRALSNAPFARILITVIFESTLADPADKHVWAHRALRICALVVQGVFGDESTSNRWRELRLLVQEQERTKPHAFVPIFFRERNPTDRRWFPEVCYATDEYVTGIQLIILAKLLLTMHDPTLPRISPKMKSAKASM